jgi:hypothetical protein
MPKGLLLALEGPFAVLGGNDAMPRIAPRALASSGSPGRAFFAFQASSLIHRTCAASVDLEAAQTRIFQLSPSLLEYLNPIAVRQQVNSALATLSTLWTEQPQPLFRCGRSMISCAPTARPQCPYALAVHHGRARSNCAKY